MERSRGSANKFESAHDVRAGWGAVRCCKMEPISKTLEHPSRVFWHCAYYLKAARTSKKEESLVKNRPKLNTDSNRQT
eukprot:6283076-Pyramimonas_sp.AAC.2